MNNPVSALLAELRERGIELETHGPTLRVRPRDRVDDELLARLRQAKPHLIAALAGPREPSSDCYPCARCGRFAFAHPTVVCWWCSTTRAARA